VSEIRRKPSPVAGDLLRTKLSPPSLHGALLPCIALLARLDQGLAQKATLVAAPDEVHWVLKPGGQALIVDLRADASVPEIDRYVDQMGMG
jgi:hypothetical protein